MASPLIVEITDSNFENEVIKSSLPILVDFWATWCAPCRTIAPHVEAMAQTFAGKVRVGKCDIDTSPMIPTQYEVRSVPTLLMFKGGQVLGQLVGPVARTRIEELVRKAL